MPDAGQIEDDWNRALDAAQRAVHANQVSPPVDRLDQEELRREAARLQEERKWFAGYRTTLRRLLPSRRSD